ncbi:hypothetical protein Bca52824_008724 [Brassica carinata]|uniref:Uncharacterized protein n=1 Tax=Brassica carinata TaxID=52824 RepID=A0A8X7W9R0_BRACI|nr:hypothetical protein Bca52824_008724 [Brassica carinata]
MEKETEEEGGSHHHHHHHHHQRICDYCESSVALVYCKADSAKLCLACDKQVHVTNQLFSKHFRSLLCDSCDDSPSSVFCDTESSVLCQNCDWQHHTSSSSLHSRRPLEGFSGCPSVTELLALLGLDDLTDKPLFLPEGSEHTPPEIVSLNDLVASGGSSHNYRAMDVPPLPKNRHATCGRQKEEMIRQLRELSRSEPSCLKYETLDAELDTTTGFLFLEPGNDLFSSTFESQVSGLKWFEDQQQEDYYSYSDDNNNNVNGRDRTQQQQQESSSSVMVPVTTTTRLTTTHEINSLERNSALSRYKAKKKSRRYEKHIRYESRKARAECRTRIRGRFAKSHP